MVEVCKCVLLLWHLMLQGRVRSQPLDHQEAPLLSIFKCMSVFPKFPTGKGESGGSPECRPHATWAACVCVVLLVN